MQLSHVASPKLLRIYVVLPTRVIIVKLLSLKGMDKNNYSSVLLIYPLLPIIWHELQAHPNLWWDFEVNTLLQNILIKNRYGGFDEMVGRYERSMWYPVGVIITTTRMYLIMHPMCAFHIHCSYRWFPVYIKLVRLIVAINNKLTYITYEAQLVLIIEIIVLNDQLLNISVQHLLKNCGTRMC